MNRASRLSPLFSLLSRLLLLVPAVAALAVPAQLIAQTGGGDEIKPPFGLQWGESSERLDKLLKGAKAKVVEKYSIKGRDAWIVEGLIQTGLKRAIFYFRNGSLVEVELQYQDATWDAVKYNDFMAQVRRRIEQRFGTGQLIAREKKPVKIGDEKPAATAPPPAPPPPADSEGMPAGDLAPRPDEVIQTMVGYQWNHGRTAIQLLYYSAEKASEIYQTVSVHYKLL